ncbi:hypothetical protein PsYK624_123040 [Phanerochaete sordida]|uniref:Uncharacterized protein n=1 Tax=Phanerochaete sordida TaxID=48140 RepID=A0A9P3GJG9_9APHY|nr:hypothetical protein PsYK624_123040 [Phanerochaete sordida]
MSCCSRWSFEGSMVFYLCHGRIDPRRLPAPVLRPLCGRDRAQAERDAVKKTKLRGLGLMIADTEWQQANAFLRLLEFADDQE